MVGLFLLHSTFNGVVIVMLMRDTGREKNKMNEGHERQMLEDV